MMINEALLICLFVLITGACIGSFLNVVALRALSKESIIFPSSKCPECGEHIKWYDNIPVLSYFFTFKGKCRNCGCKVSLQYPIVEALTAVLFLAVYIVFGPTLKSLLLLILLCTSIVITITDIKKEYVFDSHSWVLIIFSVITSLYLVGWNNYSFPVYGLIAGVFIMEIIARISYYLVKKDIKQEDEEPAQQEENQEETKQEEASKTEEAPKEEVQAADTDKEKNDENDDEDINIDEYMKKNKRAFGEGDTYLAAAAGALLGWKYIFVAIALAILLQAIGILPQFLRNLYVQKEYRLLTSILLFFVFAAIYWVLSNTLTLPFVLVLIFVLLLTFFAIDTIVRLKKTVNQQGFVAIPFGPALLLSMFLTFFFGKYIVLFVIKHVFLLFG